MGSVLSWAANTVLFVAGCFLAADTANEIIASLLTPPPETSVEQKAPAPTRQRTWAERQIILSRNLFNSSTLAPPPPPETSVEEIEKSELPLELLGTFASPDPALARAALEEKGKRETLVVRVGEEVLNGKATVIRIERRRVILSENGVARELTLDEGDSAGRIRTARAAPRRPSRRNPRRPAARQPSAPDIEDLGGDRFSVSREDLEDAINNPTNLLTQARILPKFEDGQMVGLEVNAIKPGSVFEDVGMQDGDVITELNGIEINSPDEGLKILREFNDATVLNFSGYNESGRFTKSVEVPQNE